MFLERERSWRIHRFYSGALHEKFVVLLFEMLDTMERQRVSISGTAERCTTARSRETSRGIFWHRVLLQNPTSLIRRYILIAPTWGFFRLESHALFSNFRKFFVAKEEKTNFSIFLQNSRASRETNKALFAEYTNANGSVHG